MSEIVQKIKKIAGVRSAKGCNTSQINDAQRELNMSFPEEYVDYVKAFGCIDFGSIEWTGLNINGYFNTVTATKDEISFNPNFPKGFFVLHDVGMDAQKVIVNEEGKVFLLQYDKLSPLCDSMSAYLDLCLKLDAES